MFNLGQAIHTTLSTMYYNNTHVFWKPVTYAYKLVKSLSAKCLQHSLEVFLSNTKLDTERQTHLLQAFAFASSLGQVKSLEVEEQYAAEHNIVM